MSVYRKYGLRAIINASGPVTRLGGMPMESDVLDAYVAAAAATVPLEQLQAAASDAICQVTGTDAALVTSGAAAGLMLGTAAILARLDPSRMEQLPHTRRIPHEFLVARGQRSGYDHAVRLAGAHLIEVGYDEVAAGAGVRRPELWEFDAAITDRTAGILYVYQKGSQPALSELVQQAHRRGVPVLVDAAAELPPRDHLATIPGTGADLVCFSGGKALGGPQATGILCGRRELIASAFLQMIDMDEHPELWEPPSQFLHRDDLPGLPRHGIGRVAKVAKEQIVSLLTALERFTGEAVNERLDRHRDCLAQVEAALPNLTTAIEEADGRVRLVIDVTGQPRSAFDLCTRLRQGDPPVYVSHGRLAQNQLVIDPACVLPDDYALLTERLRSTLFDYA